MSKKKKPIESSEKTGRKTPMVRRMMRFKVEEANRIQLLADLYAGGNFSKWVRFAAVNCSRRMLK